jgi:hypothetical protein
MLYINTNCICCWPHFFCYSLIITLRVLLLSRLSQQHLVIFTITVMNIQWLCGWKFLLNFMIPVTVKIALIITGSVTHAGVVTPVVIGVITCAVNLGDDTPWLTLLHPPLLLLLLV